MDGYLVHGVHGESVGPETVVNRDERQAGTVREGKVTKESLRAEDGINKIRAGCSCSPPTGTCSSGER